MKKKKPQKISASKLKTIQLCSWLYWAQYVLRVPQKSNSGACRGSCVHQILELLSSRKKYVKFILSEKGAFPASVERLLRIYAKKLNVYNQSDMNLMREMICLALRLDFFCEGSKSVVTEKEFKMESGDFIINGFIDKLIYFSNGEMEVLDFKTSKSKFTKLELASNPQALMYSLACFKETGKIPSVRFRFLRFPRSPDQTISGYTENQLKGFEAYLQQIAEYLKDFTEEDAMSDYAADSQEKKWLCGRYGCKKDGSPAFICQYRQPLTFYAVKDKSGEVIKTAFKKSELTPGIDERIERVDYQGCPRYEKEFNADLEKFDF